MKETMFKRAAYLLAMAVFATGFNCHAAYATPAAEDASSGKRTIVFAGVEARQRNISPYIGAIHYLNGDTLSDGFFVRLDGYYSDYSYSTLAVPGGNVNAKAKAFDALIGYQKVLKGITVRGLAGPEYSDHDLSPNNLFDTNRGADFGAKVRGEIETDYSTLLYAGILGSYGTAKEHYWGRLRAGYDFGAGVIGPEGALEGNDQYNERRIGGFVNLYSLNPVYFSGSIGYSDTANSRRGGSPYGTFEVSLLF